MTTRLPRAPSRSPAGALVAAGIALWFAFGVALITAASASAHTVLVTITPAAGARLTTAPPQVVLEFNEPVGTSFVTVAVSTATGVNIARGKPTVSGGKVSQALSPDLESGGYRIAYRVVSDDGHPVTGESRFTVSLTSTGSPSAPSTSPVPTPSVTVTPGASADGSIERPDGSIERPDGSIEGRGGWLTEQRAPILGALGLLAIGGAVLLWVRRRS